LAEEKQEPRISARDHDSDLAGTADPGGSSQGVQLAGKSQQKPEEKPSPAGTARINDPLRGHQEFLRGRFKLQIESPDKVELNWLDIWSTLCAIAIRGSSSPQLQLLRSFDSSTLLAMAPENVLMELSQNLLMLMLRRGNISLPLFARITPPEPWSIG